MSLSVKCAMLNGGNLWRWINHKIPRIPVQKLSLVKFVSQQQLRSLLKHGFSFPYIRSTNFPLPLQLIVSHTYCTIDMYF